MDKHNVQSREINIKSKQPIHFRYIFTVIDRQDTDIG